MSEIKNIYFFFGVFGWDRGMILTEKDTACKIRGICQPWISTVCDHLDKLHQSFDSN